MSVVDAATEARVRDPDGTRQRILEAAFAEFYENGFQGAGMAAIVARAGVTTGALYHHFPDKTALGYAVVEEVIREPILEAYLGPLEDDGGDPLAALQVALRSRADDFADSGIRFGCPLANLTQEMAPLDEGFRARVADALRAWTDGVADALARGQVNGTVRPDVDGDRVAAFVVASVEGAFGTAKAADSVDVLRANLEVLADFLETLRPG
jgi:TetR/AcrR family transcriptional repressor of nem operon